MKNETKCLMEEYINRINLEYQNLINNFNICNLEQLIQFRIKQPYGIYQGKQYVFHGRGCRVWNEDYCLDWDFGYDFGMCGINITLFLQFLKDNKNNLAENYTFKTLSNEINIAIARGEMYEKYGLFYFCYDK